MNVLISGCGGLIGTALAERLAWAGHRVARLVRPGRPARPDDVRWDPAAGSIDREALAGHDAVVHLAGASVARRWTARRKRQIRDSRVGGTRLLSEALADLAEPPGVLAAASAVGYYGDRGDEPLTEDAEGGSGFLADVCRDWEAATGPAAQAGIRTVNLRFGLVLSPAGGALRRMLLPFRLCLGGRIGGGRQYWSWIALDDAVRAIVHVLETPSLSGSVNVTSPRAVTNRQFTAALARAVHRPAWLPMPAWLARAAFGQMAREIMLAGARVEPGRLVESGFAFRSGEIDAALRAMLG